MNKLLGLLALIDGKKTYIFTAIAALFVVIEFAIKGDYSITAFVALAGNASVAAVVASLRHAIGKDQSTKVAAMFIFLVLGAGVSFADAPATISVSSVLQSVNIPTTIDQLKTKAVNAGYFYNWKDAKVQPTFTYDVGGSKVLSWGTIDYLDIGYASPDVLVAGPGLSLNVAVIEKKWGITAPTYIQNIINSMEIGFTPMLGLEQIGGRNRFTGGPGGYIKVQW